MTNEEQTQILNDYTQLLFETRDLLDKVEVDDKALKDELENSYVISKKMLDLYLWLEKKQHEPITIHKSKLSGFGCRDSGYCYNCRLIVEDNLCYCMGSNCPNCGEYVPGDNFPLNMRGTYDVYNRGTKKWNRREYKQ